MTAELNSEELTITDVLFGDVWICSGQSNMQFSMSQVLLMLFNCWCLFVCSFIHSFVCLFIVKMFCPAVVIAAVIAVFVTKYVFSY